MSVSLSTMRRCLAVCAVVFSAAVSHAQPAELQEANRLLKAGQAQQALDRTNAFLATKPKDAVARFIKGIAQSELGKTNDAIQTFPNCPSRITTSRYSIARKGSSKKRASRSNSRSKRIQVTPPHMKTSATFTQSSQVRPTTKHCNSIATTQVQRPNLT
jgi:hypothetical protein